MASAADGAVGPSKWHVYLEAADPSRGPRGLLMFVATFWTAALVLGAVVVAVAP